MNNKESIRQAYKRVHGIIARTWEKNAPMIAQELVNAGVDEEERAARHGNITGNDITSLVAGEYGNGLKATYDYEGKKAVRGMLTRGEVFEGISWDGLNVKFRGSVETSGAVAAEENREKLASMQPRLPYSIILLRGTPYSNQVQFLNDAQLDNMTNLMLYAKGFMKIVKVV